MYKINWYIKSYVQDTAQIILVTNWFAKFSNVNDEKKLWIWIKRVVMGFHDKHSSQNHYIWFFLIAHMQLYKLWKPEFVSFDFNLINIWPNSINANDSFSWDLNKITISASLSISYLLKSDFLHSLVTYLFRIWPEIKPWLVKYVQS